MTEQDFFNHAEKPNSRREFLKTAALVGGVGLFTSGVLGIFAKMNRDMKAKGQTDGSFEYNLNKPENIIYSAYHNGNFSSPVKCKLTDGYLVKVDGNPLSSASRYPNLPYDSTLAELALVEGAANPDIQDSVLDVLYNPRRLRKVLKRKRGTNRGDNRWETIDFNQAVDEITNGGNLFGEGNVDGIRSVFGLKDRNTAVSMGHDVEKIRAGEMTVAAFKLKYAAHLNKLIDPNHPDLGPVNNQLVFMSGNLPGGRREFVEWFMEKSFGSMNVYREQAPGKNSAESAWKNACGSWGSGKWVSEDSIPKPDYANAEHVIFFGPGFAELESSPASVSTMVADGAFNRNAKYTVVNAQLPASSQFSGWIPVEPGTEGAFAMGMCRWIIENGKLDRQFLENANPRAAESDGLKAYSSASWLVKLENGKPSGYLRADEIGIGSADEFVVIRNGQAAGVKIDGLAMEGDLDADYNSGGITAETSFKLFKKRLFTRSIAEYASACDTNAEKIIGAASEFVSHGRKTIADFHTGPTGHSNGFNNALAIIGLNILAGNPGSDGGVLINAEGMNPFHDGNAPYPFEILSTDLHRPFGTKIARDGANYETSSTFSGYPSKRPWFPLAENVSHDVIPSIGDGYPYGARVLIMHQPSQTSDSSSGQRNTAILKDRSRIPLVIACDTGIGDFSEYADYIFPDTSQWESWAVERDSVSQPVVDPLVEDVNVDGVNMPSNLEAMLVAFGKQLGLAGFGRDGLGPGNNFDHQDNWYLKAVANLAVASPSSDSELNIFRQARKHLGESVFSEERWKNSIRPELWQRAVNVLNRGGRFSYDRPENLRSRDAVRLYIEEAALAKNSLTGESFDPLPSYSASGSTDGSMGLIMCRDISYIPYTPFDNWDRKTPGYNKVFINRRDAERLNLANGSRIRIAKADNTGFDGEVQVVQSIRPGTAAIGYRHSSRVNGSMDVVIDDVTVAGENYSRAGFDPRSLVAQSNGRTLSDLTGGSESISELLVRIERV